MKTLFTGGSIETLDRPADWMLLEDGRIAALGPRDDVPEADSRVDLGGGVLIPAFRDAHVHLPTTGLYATGMDFRGERSVDAILDAYRKRSADGISAILFGGNFEDPLDRPLLAEDMDGAVGPKPALLARADMHSCVVSTGLLDQLRLDEVEGVDRDAEGRPTGYLREQAAAAAWTWFDNNMTRGQQSDAVHAAIEIAYSKGVAEVHEMFVVEWRGWESAAAFIDIVEPVALRVELFLGTSEVSRVKELGYDRIGGDFFLDGSFGSHTAWLQRPYASPPPAGSTPTGISYRSDEDLYGFFRKAQEAGLQVGVHAIGDAAIEQCLATWEAIANDLGVEQVRRKRHRIEHFECASDDHIERAARLNMIASVQPAFDLYWGGTEKLYAERLGGERALGMNRFRSMLDAGLELLAGSDSTVTPLDPFLQMQALRDHHVSDEQLDADTALRLHTVGSLQTGAAADLALIDRNVLHVEPSQLTETGVLGTWIGGRRVWPVEEAESA
jgi:predicted amidohydrolase YtcJ